MKALVQVDAKHGPVWLVTYEEKEVGFSIFESEERKLAFLSPSSLVDVDSGAIMEFKEVKNRHHNKSSFVLHFHVEVLVTEQSNKVYYLSLTLNLSFRFRRRQGPGKTGRCVEKRLHLLSMVEKSFSSLKVSEGIRS